MDQALVTATLRDTLGYTTAETTALYGVQALWDQVLTMSILPMTEKYSSQVYLSLSETAAEASAEPPAGYARPAAPNSGEKRRLNCFTPWRA